MLFLPLAGDLPTGRQARRRGALTGVAAAGFTKVGGTSAARGENQQLISSNFTFPLNVQKQNWYGNTYQWCTYGSHQQ